MTKITTYINTNTNDLKTRSPFIQINEAQPKALTDAETPRFFKPPTHTKSNSHHVNSLS